MQPTPSFPAPLDGIPVHGRTPYAEATVDGDALIVDVWSPDRSLDDLDVHVEANAIHLVSRSQPAAYHAAVVLPARVEPGVHVARSMGSLIEVRMILAPSD